MRPPLSISISIPQLWSTASGTETISILSQRRFPRPTPLLNLNPIPKPRLSQPLLRRFLTSPPPPPPNTTTAKTTSRADRILSKLPRYLHPYTHPLLTHPKTHLTSFLILHELTAIIPLFALFSLFQLTSWNPSSLLPSKWFTDEEGGYMRFKRYLEKKDIAWVGGRQVVDLAVAWALVKAVMPVRVLISVVAAPWFARTVVGPVVRVFRR
ncbi:hypothetical protein TWF730_009370 [Orbilia blumenaviensis]|uniref:Uncharacterized protein n=1 Tax=Orbilia blumenaviensis TaxID=1796055 RepID=A0AAV9V4N3_9PEZI